METFYHGTDFDDLISIADQGEILSQWYQEVRFLETQPDEYTDLFLKDHGLSLDGFTSRERVALELSTSGYVAQEIEFRIKCVALTSDFSEIGEDFILGFQNPIFENYKGSAISIQKKVELTDLTELHLPKDVRKDQLDFLKMKFQDYTKNFILD